MFNHITSLFADENKELKQYLAVHRRVPRHLHLRTMNTQQLDIAKRQLDIDRRQLEIENTQQLTIAKRQLDIDRRQLEIEIQEADIAAAKVAAAEEVLREENKKLLLAELERNKVAAVTAENYELAISIRDKIDEILAPGLPTHIPSFIKFMTTSKKTKTLGWTKIMDYTAYINQAKGLVEMGWSQLSGRTRREGFAITQRGDGERYFHRDLRNLSSGYGGYITKGASQAWIRVQTTDPNELLKNMNKESGSAVYISPGADIELLKMSGFEIIWATEDTIA
jgi:hypothetical protein